VGAHRQRRVFEYVLIGVQSVLMRKLLRFLVFAALVGLFAHDGNSQISPGGVIFTAPTFAPVLGTSCIPGILYILTSSGSGYSAGNQVGCIGGVWTLIGGSAGGGVTSVTGTTSEIVASPTTGGVVLYLPSPVIFPGLIDVPSGAVFGTTGTAGAVGWYTADGNDVVWTGGATGVNATETWTYNPTANGQVPTSSGCSGNSCNIGWAVPTGATTNQNLRNISVALTPTTLTQCGYVNFAGTINGFHATAPDGATNLTVLVKVLTQPTRATFLSTGVSGASDISNGGEQLTSVLGKDDTTLTSWTTSFAAGTTVCFVASTFSAGSQVNASVGLAAN
jgi:hypothetical protein